jgi:hypothetical protein
MNIQDRDTVEIREIELITRIYEDVPLILEDTDQAGVSRSGEADRLLVFERTLKSSSVLRPVHTRFRTNNNCTILPVLSLRVAAEIVEVLHTEGLVTYSINELDEVTAFCDANRKPVFLRGEFSQEALNSQSERTAAREKEFLQWEESLHKWLRRVEDEGNSRLAFHTKMVA